MWSNIANSPSKTIASSSIKQESSLRNELNQQENNNNNNESIQSDGHSTLEQTTISAPGGSPLMRYKHAICSSPGGFIYIHGGRFGNLALEDDVWRFDAHQNSWLQLETWGSAKPTNLQEHTLIEFNEQLYLFGGQVSASNQENSFWRLELATNEWHSLSMKSSKRFGTYLGPTNRRGHSAVIYKSSMFIFGGYEDFRGSSAQLWQYDLLQQRWELTNLSSTSACHPEPRHSHSAIIYEHSMYIYGGLSDLKPLSDLWRWSWRDKRWFKERTRGQSPGQLHGHTAIQAFGSMFVFGGERRHGRPTRSLWRLNLANLSWQKIRPKGPRPSATTWHAAIANPLNILDEANYIIEGADEDAKLLLAHPATSMGYLHDDHLHQSDEPVQRDFPNANNHNVRPMNIINSENDDEETPVNGEEDNHQRSKQPSKSSSMTLNSSLKFNSMRAQSKRRLRLSFLSRKNNNNNNKTKSGSIIPSSLSAANLISTFNQTKQTLNQPIEETAQRHSIAITQQTQQGNSEHVHMDAPEADNNDNNNTKMMILDSLDTDIKQMFQEAMEKDERDGRGEVPMAKDDTGHELTRDSFTTNSQLSQTTYQTARDHLTRSNTINTNNSTMTLTTNGAPTTTGQQQTSCVVRREHSGPRNPRPKSEIVQSLIDRADARIKHLYTPFFNTNNGHHHHHHHHHNHTKSAFDSNDPLLGKLQNHRMFERSSTARERRRENRLSLDKSKRHTIHQTMTYYNLYFSEDKNGLQSATVANEEHQTTRKLVRDDLSSSTIKGTTTTTTTTSCSSGAALVGVRDGTNSSSHSTSGSQMDQLSSLAATLQNSSESRTICGSRDVVSNDANGDSNPDNLLSTNEEHQQRQQQIMNARDTTTSESGDNTSMSFSVIAEFEEDDMLQYSSPTDPKINLHERSREAEQEQRMQVENGHDRDHDHDLDDQEDEYEQEYDHEYLNGGLGNQNLTRQTVAIGQQQVGAHKSASSGYDSIHSSYEHNRQRRPVNGHSLDAQEDSSVRSESSIGDPSPIRNNQQDNHSKHNGLRPTDQSHKTITTTASSTTTDSLALTSSDAFDSSMSHYYQVGQSTSTQHHQQQQQQPQIPSKSLPSSPPGKPHQQSMKLSRDNTTASSDVTIAQHPQTKPLLVANQCQRVPFVTRSARFFSKKKSKTRYWQLCMFVIGGKQSGGGHGTNEPITMWRLYI